MPPKSVPATRPYKLEFYEDPNTGRFPVYEWITSELTPRQRRAIGTAMDLVLQVVGADVAGTEYGKALGEGLFEFRLRRKPKIVLRVFFHPHGARLILLLAAYDKAKEPSDKREDDEIKLARKRLTDYLQRQKRGS